MNKKQMKFRIGNVVSVIYIHTYIQETDEVSNR